MGRIQPSRSIMLAKDTESGASFWRGGSPFWTYRGVICENIKSIAAGCRRLVHADGPFVGRSGTKPDPLARRQLHARRSYLELARCGISRRWNRPDLVQPTEGLGSGPKQLFA